MNKVLKGVDQIMEYTGLSLDMVSELKKHYDLPVKHVDSATTFWWEATTKELEEWLKKHGFKMWSEVNIGTVRAFLIREMRKGPGPVFTGDMTALCDKLRIGIGTFVDLLRRDDSPIKKVEEEGSNQYTIDLHRWQDFVEKKAKEGRRNPW